MNETGANKLEFFEMAKKMKSQVTGDFWESRKRLAPKPGVQSYFRVAVSSEDKYGQTTSVVGELFVSKAKDGELPDKIVLKRKETDWEKEVAARDGG